MEGGEEEEEEEEEERATHRGTLPQQLQPNTPRTQPPRPQFGNSPPRATAFDNPVWRKFIPSIALISTRAGCVALGCRDCDGAGRDGLAAEALPAILDAGERHAFVLAELCAILRRHEFRSPPDDLHIRVRVTEDARLRIHVALRVLDRASCVAPSDDGGCAEKGNSHRHEKMRRAWTPHGEPRLGKEGRGDVGHGESQV